MKVIWQNILNDLPVVTNLTPTMKNETVKIDYHGVEIVVSHIYNRSLKKYVYKFKMSNPNIDDLQKLENDISNELGANFDVEEYLNQNCIIISWESNFCGSPRSIYERKIPLNDFELICRMSGLSLIDEKELCKFLSECEISTGTDDQILSFNHVNNLLSKKMRKRIHGVALIVLDVYKELFK